jgi:hypothetical protein
MEQTISPSTSVHVTNISSSASEKTVSDFFSFCGKIDKLFLKKEENGTSSAVVQFETESAAKTALLLTNALIVDRPITVVPHQVESSQTTGKQSPAHDTNRVPDAHITQRDFRVPDDQRTKTSVIASLLAAGYVLGQDTLVKAKDYDEKHSISVQAKVAVEVVKTKVHEIDTQYGISEKASQLKQQATEQAKKLDDQYHLTEKATVVKSQVQSVATKVTENPTVAKGITTAYGTYESLKTQATTMYNDYKTQVDKAIEEKQKEKGNLPAQNPGEHTEQVDVPEPKPEDITEI